MKKLMAFMAAASLLLVSCEKKVDVIDDSSVISSSPSVSESEITTSGESSASETPSMEDYKAAREVLDKFYDAMLINLNAEKLLEYSNIDMMYMVSNTEPVSYEELLATMEQNLGGAAQQLGIEASSYEIFDAVVVEPVIITTANNFIKKKEPDSTVVIDKALKFNANITTNEGTEPQEMFVSQINGEWKVDMALVPYINIIPPEEADEKIAEAQKAQQQSQESAESPAAEESSAE